MAELISATSLNTISSYVAASGSTAILQVQLDRFRAQLADWVTCPSCNTIEGKAKIAQISARIGEIELQLKSAQTSKPEAASAVVEGSALAANARSPAVSAVGTAGSVQNELPVAVESRLDLFA